MISIVDGILNLIDYIVLLRLPSAASTIASEQSLISLVIVYCCSCDIFLFGDYLLGFWFLTHFKWEEDTYNIENDLELPYFFSFVVESNEFL